MKRRFPFTKLDMEERGEILLRLERVTELPLLVLSFVMIPILLGPYLWDLSEVEDNVFHTLDGFIWALFVIDIAAKIIIAPNRLRYALDHWLEVLVALLPFIRPLRLVRLFVFGSRAVLGARRLVNIDFILVYALGVVIIGATVVTAAEQGRDTIESFPDALWWSVVTVTTVGYGDMTPETVAGRAVAVVLMIGGIGLFGGLTANLASAIVKSEDQTDADLQTLLEEVRALREQVGGIEQATAEAASAPSRGFSLTGAANIIRGGLSGALSRLRRGGQQPRPKANSGGETMPDSQTFRQAWGKFATGVSVVTTVRADGEIHGMTANGINSVSLNPPLALVCAGHSTSSYPLIKESRRFAISILSEDQRAVAEYFARPTDEKTGDLAASFSFADSGAALLDGSLARMDCRVIDERIAGDHTIFIGEVESIDVSEGKPLLFFEGRFGQIAES